MGILLKDLIANRRLLAELRGRQQTCCECGVVLQETITGKRRTPKGCACSDCYYDLLGTEIERNPPTSPGIRRG